MTDNELHSFISKQESLLRQMNTDSEKAQILYEIINAKRKIKSNPERYDLYIDVKRFISHYFRSIDSESFGYDSVKYDKFEVMVSVLDYNQQKSIIQYTKRYLKKRGFELELEDLDGLMNRLSVNYYKQNIFRDFNFFKILPAISSKNVTSIVTTLLIIILIETVCLLPAPAKQLELFSVKFLPLTEYQYINLTLNQLLSQLCIFSDDEFKVLPLNVLGAFFLVLSQAIKYLLVTNFLFKQLEKITL